MTQIPEWIVKYDQANYQSSAGKAVRFLLQELEEAQRLHQTYFDKFNETFGLAIERTNEKDYWKKASEKWLEMHKNHAAIIDELSAKISHLESLVVAADEMLLSTFADGNLVRSKYEAYLKLKDSVTQESEPSSKQGETYKEIGLGEIFTVEGKHYAFRKPSTASEKPNTDHGHILNEIFFL